MNLCIFYVISMINWNVGYLEVLINLSYIHKYCLRYLFTHPTILLTYTPHPPKKNLSAIYMFFFAIAYAFFNDNTIASFYVHCTLVLGMVSCWSCQGLFLESPTKYIFNFGLRLGWHQTDIIWLSLSMICYLFYGVCIH